MADLPDMKDAALALRALKDKDGPGGESSGWRQVAVLLVSLGEELAAELLQGLDTAEVEQIARAIADLESVSRETQERAVAEFEAQLSAGRFPASGGERVARDMLEAALGADGARAMWARMGRRDSAANAFELLNEADPAQVAPFLAQQHPQTIALILSQIEAGSAAALLDSLPPGVHADIAHRIATLEQVSPDILDALEETLREELPALSGARAVDGAKVAADILNRVGSSVEKRVMGRLDAQDPETAEQIRDEMFVFDDLSRLNSKEVAILLQHVDHDDVVVSLKSAGKGTVEALLAAVSERRRQLILDDLAALPPMRLKDVEEAQQRIVQHVRRLEEQQLIKPARGGADDTYV